MSFPPVLACLVYHEFVLLLAVSCLNCAIHTPPPSSKQASKQESGQEGKFEQRRDPPTLLRLHGRAMAAAAATVAAAAPAASRSVCLDSRIADSFTACSTSNAPPSRLALPRNPKQRQGNSQWQQHRNVQHQICAALTADRPFMSRTDEYNRSMQKQMLNPYEYHHELGEFGLAT